MFTSLAAPSIVKKAFILDYYACPFRLVPTYFRESCHVDSTRTVPESSIHAPATQVIGKAQDFCLEFQPVLAHYRSQHAREDVSSRATTLGGSEASPSPEGLFVSRDGMTPTIVGSGTRIACRTRWLRERRVLPSHLVRLASVRANGLTPNKPRLRFGL